MLWYLLCIWRPNGPPYVLKDMRSLISIIKILSIVAIVALFLYGGFYVMKEADVAVPLVFQPIAGVRKVMSLDAYTFVRSENGRIAWRLQAKTADLLDNKEARLHDLQIDFSDPGDEKHARLTGDIGSLNTENGNATVRRENEDVRIVTSDGYVLTTTALSWNAGKRTISSDEPFKLLGSEIYLDGRGITANVDMQSIEVNEHVKAVLQE